MRQSEASLSWFVLLLPLGLAAGALAGLLIGATALTSFHTGFFWGIVCGPPIFGLIGLALDRRHTARRDWLLSSAILLVSLLLAAYILWRAAGPVRGDMRRIETTDAITIQRAEPHWFFPNRWEVYSVTPKIPEASDGS